MRESTGSVGDVRQKLEALQGWRQFQTVGVSFPAKIFGTPVFSLRCHGCGSMAVEDESMKQ